MTMMERFEKLIRAGRFSQVASVLSEIDPKRVARADLAKIANIANRIDQSQIAFRLLYPFVRSERRAAAPSSEAERLEYAEALRRMGLVNEALEIFASLDAAKMPAVRLRIAFCLFNKWRYDEAIPQLRALIDAIDEKDYLATIARVNLAAALVHEGHDDEALVHLEELSATTRAAKQDLLLGNCLELMAQIHVRNARWALAEDVLARATDALSADDTKYARFVKKWRAIAASLKSGKVHPDLIACRREAEEKRDYETQRDCDLYVAVTERDASALLRLYFGSPHPGFRKKIVQLSAGWLELPPSYVWEVPCANDPDEKPELVFDLTKARTDDGDASLETGRLMHRLLILLCHDFYRPLTIGSAFNALFDGERFAQQGSANRVAQVVKRLRTWLKENDLGLVVVEKGGTYRLVAERPVGIRLATEAKPASRESVVWKSVKRELSGDLFTRRDLSRISASSPASAKRLLKWAIDAGEIQAVGAGSRVRYKVA